MEANNGRYEQIHRIDEASSLLISRSEERKHPTDKAIRHVQQILGNHSYDTRTKLKLIVKMRSSKE